ncbi:hypothetical protein MQC88_06555 [Luteimonas sp. 50]|uniref:Uncharacterized protein n=1 Tax=Cognatiluteimonas sedimenti TaxID=2927791 RepID=A0ABT0A3R7_9GAMM|nr:hypothetical protein [Lysobacter sedimenti]MCJ0825619.1 hypothetical protein [Lysobacter sedimenti]
MTLPRISLLALAVAALAIPNASRSASNAIPQLYMDVATHDMAGMPAMGGLGRMAMGMFGGRGQASYGMTRMPGMPGQYLDIALYNGSNPAPEASQAIPAGLRLGNSLPLLPPPPARASSTPGSDVRGIADGGEHTSRILVYWGCGTEVRAGQPREIRISLKNGKADISGSMPQGRSSPDRAINPGPEYALWPNPRSQKQVPDGASLVGQHQVSGPGVPASMKFELERMQDFMPRIALSSSGGGAAATTWSWKPVDRATGYFLSAMGQKDDALVMWSSAEMPEPGSGLMDYLPEATVAKWIGERVLLGPQVDHCAIPRGIFGEGAGMTQMIAYGPERNIAWPPRPADAKAAWKPEWNVRVRAKSTAFAPMGMGNIGGAERGEEAAPADEGKPVKKLLRGLLGR